MKKGSNNMTMQKLKSMVKVHFKVLNIWMNTEMNIGMQENYKEHYTIRNGVSLKEQLRK